MENQEESKHRPVALVTGASSGIGRAVAVLHATRGGDLVVTARRESALQELKSELEQLDQNVRVLVIVADLSQPNGAQYLYDQVKASGLQVDYLINNAGFGGYGKVVDRNLQDDLNMIQVNVTSLVTLTRLFGADMVRRGGTGGKILNVGSIAGFMPGPYQATYFATKAFVMSFSQAVDHELRGQGVTCTVLAPGVTDTDFFRTAHLEGTQLARTPPLSVDYVARIGYEAMLAGRLLVTCNWKSRAMEWVFPLLPRRTLLKIVENEQRKDA